MKTKPSDVMATVELLEKPEAIIVQLRGDFSISNSPTLWGLHTKIEDAINRQHRNVIIDGSQVGYTDSSAIAFMVATLALTKKLGVDFSITANEKLWTVLNIARLTEVMSVTRA